ncbi:MAG: pilus assembly protein TadG-related protein [Intrasporangium sp.]|uniref:pilus assembly protein TadG-related protein n=1 Tax=Intrasporangium sp. TaxID=1925024 RepID=UPI002649BD0E|nr:pilus assembly protein TadG-related protein [Intrasporangium sp.]MDN5795226.1 pilus assembly protein TadG-related protein [Intrasporangium sp.]
MRGTSLRRVRHPLGWPHRSDVSRDDGQIGILILGLFAIVALLIVGAIDVTAAQLARTRILDTADALALDAADALEEGSAYGGGVQSTVALSDASVRAAAADHLERTPLPAGLTGWGLVDGTGTPDGSTAVVRLRGQARLPMTGGVLDSLGGSVTITVESRARAPLQ